LKFSKEFSLKSDPEFTLSRNIEKQSNIIKMILHKEEYESYPN